MIHTDVFSHLSEELELDRQAWETAVRMDKLLNDQNLEIVTIGKLAVAQGLFTMDNVYEQTWKTVARHRELMRAVGYANIVRPESTRSALAPFNIGSRRVSIAPDIALVLRQQGRNLKDSQDFWACYEERGLEGALDEYVYPGSTTIDAEDMETGRQFCTTELSPRVFKLPDPRFNEKWRDSMRPFILQPACDSPYLKQEREQTPGGGPRAMTDKELIVAAGFNLRFNSLLDEAAANLP